MPSNYSDRLADYVDVKERLRLFYEFYPLGSIVTAEAYMQEDPDGKVRVWAKALAYRTADDPMPTVGWSYLEVPGTTPYTRGSEIENVETSAWGRAIGALGIGISKSIATTDEIDAKAGEAERKPSIRVLTAPDKDPGGITGTAEIGTAKDSDFQLRETPDGWALGFRLVSDKGGIKVIAYDAIAQALAASVGETVGKRVTVWGRIKDEEFTPKGAKRPIRYQVLTLERIKTPEYELPATVAPGQEPLDFGTQDFMIPSIDYLTIVLSGSIMLAGAANTLDGGRFNKTGFALAVAGLFLFIVGTARAFMSAFGL